MKKTEVTEKLASIRLLALDVDGVLTDGKLLIGPDGEVAKAFSARDGMAISIALRNDLQVAIITGRPGAIIKRRAGELGISKIMSGIKDKGEAIRKLSDELGIGLEETAFMGDDLNDLPAMKAAFVGACPCNAAKEVLERADYISDSKGGESAVRNFIEDILKARGLWDSIIASYSDAGQGDRQ